MAFTEWSPIVIWLDLLEMLLKGETRESILEKRRKMEEKRKTKKEGSRHHQ